jgi:hypothetical protein
VVINGIRDYLSFVPLKFYDLCGGLQRADDLHRQQPDATIADIIARSGFDSPSNYYKAKRKYGEC